MVRQNQTPPAAYPTGALPALVTLFHEYYLEDMAYAGNRFIELCVDDATSAGLILILLSRSGNSAMRRTSMGLLAALTAYDRQAGNRLLVSLLA